MKAYLNGIELTQAAANLSEMTITYTGRTKSDYSESVEFTGWAYDLLKSQLIDDPKGYLKSVPFRVEQDCCTPQTVFNGAVRGDKIDWNSDGCIITAAITQEDEESDLLRKIRSTLISDHLPTVNPLILAFAGKGLASVYLNFLVANFLIILMVVLIPVVAIISGIVSIFDRGALNEAMDFMNNAIATTKNNALKSVGQIVAAPLVREMLIEPLAAIGLTFESSILNDAASPYFNLGYLAIQQKNYSFASRAVIPENIPIRTIEQILSELSIFFNGAWDVYGDKLVFERRDNLPDAGAFDITGEEDLRLGYSWNTEQKNAYFDLQYNIDIDEKGGNAELNGFNEIVEWNASANENQSGAFKVDLPFSAYVLDFPFNSSGIASLLKGFVSALGLNVPSGKHLEISGQYIYVPKMIPLLPSTNASGLWAAADPENVIGQALYNNFYFIEDPNYSGFRGLEFTAQFNASCAFKDAAKEITRVNIPYGNTTALGYVNSIEINYATNRATIKGNF